METIARRWVGAWLFAALVAVAGSGCTADAHDPEDADDDEVEAATTSDELQGIRLIRRPCDISRASLEAQARSFCVNRRNFRVHAYHRGFCGPIPVHSRMWFSCPG